MFFFNNNPSIAIMQLDSIVHIIDSLNDDDEKIFLWSAVAVARNSIQYWTSSKGQLWINKLNSLYSNKINSDINKNTNIIVGIDDQQKVCDINWNAVGYADFVGFCNAVKNNAAKIAVIAVRSAIVGALNSGGLAAVPAAILGAAGGALQYGIKGAIVASAGCIAWQIAFGSL